MSTLAITSRLQCAQQDAEDPLRHVRERFTLPKGMIYLDGNSLGALPSATASRVDDAIRHHWGNELIQAWQRHQWVGLPQRLGGKIAALVGAGADEVIVTDSTSINIFKLLAGALALPDIRSDGARTGLLCEADNFPSDTYIASGLAALLANRFTVRAVPAEDMAGALDATTAVALMSHVDYRTGTVHDMHALNAAAARAGTRIVWDLSHSAGALPVTLNACATELAVGCGYKYLNGGPGAPAYAYVARALQTQFASPLQGWFGHAAPFAFSPNYVAAPGMTRLLCGTPSVLSLTALEAGVDTFAGVDLAAVRAKSLALSDLFLHLLESRCPEAGFRNVTPLTHAARGSQISLAHPAAETLIAQLRQRGVIGDFRHPNLLRFGFTPLYTRAVDVWDAVTVLAGLTSPGAPPL